MVKKAAVKTGRQKTQVAGKKVKKTVKKTIKTVKKTVKTVEKPAKTGQKTVKPAAAQPAKKTPVPVLERKTAPVLKKKVKPAAHSPAAANKALTPAEIEDFQKKLLALRSRLRGEVNTMTHVALNEKDDGQSMVPLHMADVASDNFEREQTLSFIESENNTLFLIEDALTRIREGNYGICENCGCHIPKPRLNYIPFASACVKCVEEMEN
ncbi:MAG: TraR/DksA C4-type zinc finger protein [Planctomycetaceae bacterium]|nr:TraR/DksA C4-type zinc finger protein [Planctomycetaceae bacterium]